MRFFVRAMGLVDLNKTHIETNDRVCKNWNMLLVSKLQTFVISLRIMHTSCILVSKRCNLTR
jgi:hypothetical protein